jgi:hypothetical protein
MNSILNDTIRSKLEELSCNKDEYAMCVKILILENDHHNDPNYDFRTQIKHYLDAFFPYVEES